VVRTDGECYRLHPDPRVDIDLLRFRGHLAAEQALRRAGAPAAERVRELEAAAALIRGEPLADEPYAEWASEARARLLQEFADTLTGLAALHSAAGRPDLGLPFLRQALRHDSAREDLHERLISALLVLRRRREAAAQSRASLRVLREELGAEPGPALARLIRAAQAEVQQR
jgi:DNA-binding SARP family transcriptional activator